MFTVDKYQQVHWSSWLFFFSFDCGSEHL
jgi:hypothetical protein